MKTFDPSTLAALPSQLVASRRFYARYFSDTEGQRLMRSLATRLPWFMHRAPWIGPSVFHWTRVREIMQSGCLNPAMVLDPHRTLIAVFTNLSNDEDQPDPVVKILDIPARLIDASLRVKGTRLAAACAYWRNEGGHPGANWDDFTPLVADCFVEDPGKCREARERIKPMAWKALEVAVASIERRDQPGLYSAKVPSMLVRNCF